jgi:hypothetical protein
MPTMKGSTAVSDPTIPSQRNALRGVLVQLLPCRTLTCRSMLTLSICQTSRSNHHDTYEPLGVPLFFRGIDRCGTDLARRAVVVLRRRYQSQSLLSGSSPALDRRNGTSWQSKSVVQRTPAVSTHHLKAVASSCRGCLRIYLEQCSSCAKLSTKLVLPSLHETWHEEARSLNSPGVECDTNPYLKRLLIDVRFSSEATAIIVRPSANNARVIVPGDFSKIRHSHTSDATPRDAHIWRVFEKFP